MDVIDRLITAIDKSGVKHIRIAEDAGMKATKFSKIYRRKQVPNVIEYIAIARAIRLDPARLFTDGELVVELQALRDAVSYSEGLHRILSNWLPESPVTRLPGPIARPPGAAPRPAANRDFTPVRAAADPNAELLVEFEKERKRIPRGAWNRGARRIARVVGDSMDGGSDPIRNGELAYLKPTRSPRTANNHVVLISRGEGVYLKLFELSGRTVRLVSTNGEDPIQFDAAEENVRIYGYVVGHAFEGNAED